MRQVLVARPPAASAFAPLVHAPERQGQFPYGLDVSAADAFARRGLLGRRP
ncbi:hypothetical protein AB0D04_24540 [Streptomyces sp. NPDC048483]|uniref:hypothetical protein n=1 Tax=Streptomyces sp. NPDC048483 TaxID=3154927 RepID=UPI00343A9FEC